jgi:hypothetical protein
MGIVPKIGYQLLFLHYIMANILADTCLRPDDEMAFDSHGNGFASIIAHSFKVLEGVRTVHNSNNPVFRSGSELFFFSADIGWAPPLYYTALHCRIHHIRLQAIRLLRAIPSKEGIWDSRFAASVAEEVMRIEEGNHYNDVTVDDESLFANLPQHRDLSRPTLPESCRVYHVRIVLPDGSSGKAFLTCKRGKTYSDSEDITREYDIGRQAWIAKD